MTVNLKSIALICSMALLTNGAFAENAFQLTSDDMADGQSLHDEQVLNGYG